MSSLYAKYIAERENTHIVENEHGFATYRFLDDGVYIVDIYVDSDYRDNHMASEMADQIVEIAKGKGYTKLYGTVCPSANNSTASLKVLLAYGFKLHSSAVNQIVMVKEI